MRNEVYGPIVEQVKRRFPITGNGPPPRVLVPGAALSRLAFELMMAGLLPCSSASALAAIDPVSAPLAAGSGRVGCSGGQWADRAVNPVFQRWIGARVWVAESEVECMVGGGRVVIAGCGAGRLRRGVQRVQRPLRQRRRLPLQVTTAPHPLPHPISPLRSPPYSPG